MKLRIPKQHRKALEDLLNLSKTTLQALVRVLREEPPTVLIQDLAEHVSEKTKIEDRKALGIILVLSNLYTVRSRENIPVEDFVKDFQEAVTAEGLKPKNVSWEEFNSYLTNVISFDQSIGLSSKAFDVMTEHAKVFGWSRILTDLRPVFKADPKQSPAAAVVVHTLQIGYREGGDTKEFYVAMDCSDIKKLQMSLERAILKEESLKELMKRINLTFLDAESR